MEQQYHYDLTLSTSFSQNFTLNYNYFLSRVIHKTNLIKMLDNIKL